MSEVTDRKQRHSLADKPTNQYLLLTIDQACEQTQFCRNTIKQAIRKRELVAGKFGRMVRIRPADLQAWIDKKIGAVDSEGTLRSQSQSGMAVTTNSFTEKTGVGRG